MRWSPSKLTFVRISEKRSLCAANLGTSSVKRAPETRVAIVENGPRYSTGAEGLGSNRSRWLGPPPNQISKMDLAGDAPSAGLPAAHRDNGQSSGIANPARRNARRWGAWQSRV